MEKLVELNHVDVPPVMVERQLDFLLEDVSKIARTNKDPAMLEAIQKIGLIGVMLVAVAKVHAQHGFFLNFAMTPGRGHGYEYNLALLAMALSILIGGAGVFSIDRLIAPLGD